MKLSKIIIHKYKSFENDQEINLKDDVTILVGMNESGKTSVLEAVAKTNYFSSDPKFKFSKTHDYPRREKKKMDRSGVEPAAITCIYQISKVIKDIALKELGPNVFNNDSISRTTSYENKGSWNDLNISYSAFLDNQLNKQSIYSKTLADKLHGVKNEDELQVVINSYTDGRCCMNQFTLLLQQL